MRKDDIEDKLRVSEVNLRTILDSVHDAIFIHGLDGTIKYVNRRVIEMYRVTYGQALLLSIQNDFSSPDNPVDSLPEIWKRVISGEELIFEWKAKRPLDNSEFDVEVFLRRITLDEEEVILATVRDITERKTAERIHGNAYRDLEARVTERTAELARMNRNLSAEIENRKKAEKVLRVREGQQKAILDNIPDIAWLKDRESRFIAVNERFAYSCGRKAGELPGKTDFDIWPEDLARKYVEDDKEVIKSGKRKRIEERLVDSEEKLKWIETIKSPVYDENGEIAGTVGIARDITRRRTVEIALRENEAERRLIMDAVPALISYVDSGLRYRFVNQQYEIWFRRPASEIIGRHVQEILGGDRFREVQPFLEKALAGERASYETTMSNRNEEFELHVDYIPHEEAGKVLGFFVLITDITERRRSEKALQRAVNELSSANLELDAFNSSVSHDLRAPLRIMIEFTKIMLDEHASGIDEEGRGLLASILRHGLKMDQLITELLMFSRIGRQDMTISTLNMENLFREAFNEIRAVFSGRKISFTLKALPPAKADVILIRQVISNFLLNAFKFTRNKSVAEIEVGGWSEDSENVYYVKDNGAGFNMHLVSKLFGLFQRLHSEKDFEGTGVGLFIVKRIIIRHGGRVWAEGKTDEGATFFFTLPAAPLRGEAT